MSRLPEFPPLGEYEGGVTFANGSWSAKEWRAKAKDAERQARELSMRAAVRGRREGMTLAAIAAGLELTTAEVRKLLEMAVEQGVTK